MKQLFGYGAGWQQADIPQENLLGTLLPGKPETGSKGAEAVRRALAAPVSSKRLSELVTPGQKIVIITSDVTRPLPTHEILPPILEELQTAGVPHEDITVVFALGSHRRQTPDEMRRLVGETVFMRVRCVDSDPHDTVRLGVTSFGTPVDITRTVAEADVRIALGNIEYHYFAGYSGGAKAIVPGVSTREAIQANHSRMTLPGAAAGQMEDNPVRQDIEEALRFCPLHFILNVVLEEHKSILFAAAGHPVLAHRAGCHFLDGIFKKSIPKPADIVLASPGGMPKDINLYQAQKALNNASLAVRPGGVIILVAACGEGFGEDVFRQWMTTAASPGDMIRRIERDFQLGGHKAAAIALVLKKASVYLVSEMAPEVVQGIFLVPFPSVASALEAAFAKLGQNASVLSMPFAGATLPVVSGLEGGSS